MLGGFCEASFGRAFADGYRAFGAIVQSAEEVKMAINGQEVVEDISSG